MKNKTKLSMRVKLVISLLAIFILSIISLIIIVQTVGVNYAKERMLSEYVEEARTMATVWKYRAGGSFEFKNGAFYGANGDKISDMSKDWFDTWYRLKTTNAEMSIVEPTSGGYLITHTSFKDTKGKSLINTYITDEVVLKAIENRATQEDCNGEFTVGGKKYIMSYSFLYKDDNNNIPYICVLGEEIKSIKNDLNQRLHPYIRVTILFYTILYAILFFIILHFCKEEFAELEKKKKQHVDEQRRRIEERIIEEDKKFESLRLNKRINNENEDNNNDDDEEEDEDNNN